MSWSRLYLSALFESIVGEVKGTFAERQRVRRNRRAAIAARVSTVACEYGVADVFAQVRCVVVQYLSRKVLTVKNFSRSGASPSPPSMSQQQGGGGVGQSASMLDMIAEQEVMDQGGPPPTLPSGHMTPRISITDENNRSLLEPQTPTSAAATFDPVEIFQQQACSRVFRFDYKNGMLNFAQRT